MNKRNLMITVLFLVAILLRHILHLPNIDFVIAGLYSAAIIFFGSGTMSYKIASILIFSVLCTERIQLGGINIRFDDLITVFLPILLIFRTRKRDYKIDRVDVLIMVYVIYNIIVFLMGVLFDSTEMKYIFVLVKEVQYFLYYYFIKTLLKEENCSTELFSVIIICTLFNNIWGLYQVAQGLVGYYGIGCLSSSSSAHSGGVYLMLAIINAYIFKTTKDKRSFILSLLSIVMTIFTISRTNIIGIVLFILLIAIYYLYDSIRKNKISKKAVLFVLLFLIVISAIFLVIKVGDNYYLDKLSERFTNFNSASITRYNKWAYYLSHSSFLGIIFGNGKGLPEIIAGKGFLLGTDSQYVCQILETGIVGLMLWLIILLNATVFYKHKDDSSHKYSIIVLLIYLVMGVTLEIFQTTLQASTFWIFLALLSANEIVNNRRARKIIANGDNNVED